MALDTRKKIVDVTSLPRADGRTRVAKGWFDVLTAEQCRMLRDTRPPDGSLGVLVYRETGRRRTPLTAHDRAQMVAALDTVDWVCVCGASEADGIAASYAAGPVLDVDSAQTRDVIRDVLELHSNT